MRKYVRKNSNQVHRGNATIWQNHRMMRVAMKNMMVLPVKFGRSLGEKWQRKVEIWLNAVYAMNISGQNDKTKNILLMMIFFFFFFVLFALVQKFYCQISIHLSTLAFNYAMMLSNFIETLLIFIQGENLSFFFSVIQMHRYKNWTTVFFLSAWLVSMKIFPKGIFISTWLLPVPIKVNKQNIRTKRASSEAIVFIFETILYRCVLRTQSNI